MIKKLSQLSGMPKVTNALKGWTIPLTGYRVTQTTSDGLVTDVQTPLKFDAAVQPLSPAEIALKPEGQREWEWLQLHSYDLNKKLQLNDRFIYNGKRYKIMRPKDYSQNGYIEYHAIEDYEQNN